MEKKELGPAIIQYSFPDKMAEEIITMFESDSDLEWEKSLIGAHGIENSVRTSKQYPLEQRMPIASSRIKDIFIECVNQYIDEFHVDITKDEGLVLLKYDKNNKYDYHIDADWSIYRVVSALIYLNPHEYDGGETHFELFDLKVKPEKPSIVLFPSNYAYRHAALPVTNGTKYVIVTWMNDLPGGFVPSILSGLAGITGAISHVPHNH